MDRIDPAPPAPPATRAPVRPSSRRARRAVGWLLVLFLLARFDFWWEAESYRLLGLPIGLAYHLLYCLAAVPVLWLLLRTAWPHELATRAEEQP